jgi:hypothetical protein
MVSFIGTLPKSDFVEAAHYVTSVDTKWTQGKFYGVFYMVWWVALVAAVVYPTLTPVLCIAHLGRR